MSILRERRPIAKRCIAAGLYQKLVNKLEPSFVIKQNMLVHLSHPPFPQGEFLHVIHQARNVFIFVAHTNAEGRRQALSAQDVDNLLDFQKALLPADLLQHAYRLAPFLIIAANDKNQYADLNKKGFCFLSKMVVGNVVSLIKNEALAKASPAIQRRLQSVFSPETTIPQSLSGNDMPFLDQIQEKVLKQSLCPAPYLNGYTSNTHLYQGSAGSGKTLVLLQRAKLLQQLNPTWKLLVIAPNIAALHALQKMQCVLNAEATSIEIIGFQQWCRRHIKDVLQFIYADEAFELATEVVTRHFEDHCLTAAQLLEELAYSADRAIDTLECYLATERYGLSFALDNVDHNALRIRVWEAMQDVARALRLRNLHMACDLAPLLWYQVLQGKVELPHYDAIFIDDADGLAPIGFKLLQQTCQLTHKTSDDVDSLHMGHLFMMANRIQNISSQVHINQAYTWREANIQAIEHETVLDQCYRSSIDILQLANKFYPVEKQVSAYNVRRKSTKCWRWPHKAPILFHLTQESDEIDLLVKEIKVLLDRGMQAKDILIVQAGQTSTRPLAMLLREQLDITVSVFGDPEYSAKTLYITALNSISAIESPVVFIVGLQHLFATEAESNESKRRILYRGIMRAQHQLTLILVADTIPAELQLKVLKVIKNPTRKNNVCSLFPVSVF